MTEEDNKTEHLYLMLISVEDLKTMAEMLKNAEFWHSEMLLLREEVARLRADRENLLMLMKAHELTILKLEGKA